MTLDDNTDKFTTRKEVNFDFLYNLIEQTFIKIGKKRRNNKAANEKNKLEKELKYMKGFLASVESKLSNKRFILNAPEDVVAIEKKKVEDAKEKINLIEKSLAGF